MSYQQRGRSLRAIAADNEDRIPVSLITRARLDDVGVGYTVAFVKWLIAQNYFTTTEWHHTGTYANCTDFYEISELQDTEHYDQYLPEYQAARKLPAPDPERIEVEVTYIENHGSRNYPRMVTTTERGVRIGNWIHLADGRRKKVDANATKNIRTI